MPIINNNNNNRSNSISYKSLRAAFCRCLIWNAKQPFAKTPAASLYNTYWTVPAPLTPRPALAQLICHSVCHLKSITIEAIAVDFNRWQLRLRTAAANDLDIEIELCICLVPLLLALPLLLVLLLVLPLLCSFISSWSVSVRATFRFHFKFVFV